MKIPAELSGWIDARAKELYEGITADMDCQLFTFRYTIQWCEDTTATVTIVDADKPGLSFQEKLVEYVLGTEVYKQFQRQVKSLCELIDICEKVYDGYEFQGY